MLAQFALTWIEIARVCQDDFTLWKRCQCHRLHQGLFASSDDHRQGHSANKSTWSCFPGVEITVSVKPHETGVDAGTLEACQYANDRTAIAGNADRPATTFHGICNDTRQIPVQD